MRLESGARARSWRSSSAGASLGTRYDVQYNAQNPYGPTQIGISTLGAAQVNGLIEFEISHILGQPLHVNAACTGFLCSQFCHFRPQIQSIGS